MKLIFAGTYNFSLGHLKELFKRHEISLILTSTDKASGRHLKVQQSPVKEFALNNNISLLQADKINSSDFVSSVINTKAELMIVVSYGIIIPKFFIDDIGIDIWNVHASLLPLYRGAAPIERSIMSGDSKTGVSIMKIEQGLDTGPVAATKEVIIEDNDNYLSLEHKLIEAGSILLLDTIDAYQSSGLVWNRQNDELGTYAKKINKAEARIDWSKSAVCIDRHVRALAPNRGAWIDNGLMRAKIWSVEPGVAISYKTDPGTILSTCNGICVSCGEHGMDTIKILKIQRAGSKILSAHDFIRGNLRLLSNSL